MRICLLNQCVYKSLMCSEPLDLFLHVVEHTLSTKMWAGWVEVLSVFMAVSLNLRTVVHAY